MSQNNNQNDNSNNPQSTSSLSDDSPVSPIKENLQVLAEVRSELDEARVSSWLSAHPDFFERNPDLLAHIDLHHHTEDSTSLIERQIKVLREKNQRLQGQLIDMLWAADANEKLLVKTNNFMLALLKETSLTGLVRSLRQRLKKDFELDEVSVTLVGDYPSSDQMRSVASVSQLQQLLGASFPLDKPFCGRLTQQTRYSLFGDLGQHLESFAVIPLGENCAQGVLALASRDPLRFKPELGTLFIELIANLVVHLLQPFEQDDHV